MRSKRGSSLKAKQSPQAINSSATTSKQARPKGTPGSVRSSRPKKLARHPSTSKVKVSAQSIEISLVRDHEQSGKKLVTDTQEYKRKPNRDLLQSTSELKFVRARNIIGNSERVKHRHSGIPDQIQELVSLSSH